MILSELKVICIFLFFSAWLAPGKGQHIDLSKEINFNNDDGFELIGEINDTVLLFKENGNEYSVDLYDKDLKYLLEKELKFEKQRIHFNAIVRGDSSYTILYSFEDRFKLKLRALKFDLRGNVIDSTGIYEERDYLDIEHFSHVLSDDRTKVMLFRFSKINAIEFIYVDLVNMQRIWYKEMEFEDTRINSELIGLLLSNSGELVLAFEKNNYTFKRKKHYQHIYVIDPVLDEVKDFQIYFQSKLSTSINFVIDEKNGEVIVAGLYAPKSTSKAQGYYMYKFVGDKLVQPLMFEKFRQQLLIKYSGKRKNPKKYIDDLILKDIVLRQDGGMILLTEMQKEVMRESVRRRYVDYHYEDMIIISVHPDGRFFWDELIRKYQLSYDDQARFSSYFLFQNPSSLRIVFNDEIKSENTISEYSFNPLGNGKRSSLFSTDLHRLKLAFEDAKQVSSDSFIVPSLHNGKYRLIKISY